MVADRVMTILTVCVPLILLYLNVIVLLRFEKWIKDVLPSSLSGGLEPISLAIGTSVVGWLAICCLAATSIRPGAPHLVFTIESMRHSQVNENLLTFFRVCYSLLFIGSVIGGPLSLYVTIRSTRPLKWPSLVPCFLAVSYVTWDVWYAFSMLTNATGIAT